MGVMGRLEEARLLRAGLAVAAIQAVGWPGCKCGGGGGDTYVLRGAILTVAGMPILTKGGEALAIHNS